MVSATLQAGVCEYEAPPRGPPFDAPPPPPQRVCEVLADSFVRYVGR